MANRSIVENRQYLALWVNFYVEENNDIIGWYDHDYEESYSVDPTTNVGAIVDNMLLKDSTKKEIQEALNTLGVKSIEHIFMLLRHTYNATPAPLTLSDKQIEQMHLQNKNSVPVFAGNFKYK